MPDQDPVAPYVLLPQRLCADLRDSPAAIGVYALVARLFLITRDSVPLSAGDVARFDGQTSYGQARRALERLAATGWLSVTALGRKNAYRPTWGVIQGAPRPWDVGQPRLARPPHVRSTRLDAATLDQIAYLTPHNNLTALVRRGASPLSLSDIGASVLIAAGLRPASSESVTPAAPGAFSVAREPIDQLIPQLIGPAPLSEPAVLASQKAETVPVAPTPDIPWDSWAMNPTNQHAIPSCEADRVREGADVTVGQEVHGGAGRPERMSPEVNPDTVATSQMSRVDAAVGAGHQALNLERVILPGEWVELRALEQAHGRERLLVWQARAARRRDPVERITPAYYQACAASDAYEASLPRVSAAQDILVAGWDLAPASPGRDAAAVLPDADGSVTADPTPAASPHPTGVLAAQLRALGIRTLAGLGGCDPALVSAWVAASAHPDWALIWDDPGAAARAMLLRGEAPPDPALIARRAAARRQAAPTDWGAIAAASDGFARLGDDLSGLDASNREQPLPSPATCAPVPVAEPSAHRPSLLLRATAPDACSRPPWGDDDPAEQLRMTLRLHAPTRVLAQAVERLEVESTPEQLRVIPGRSDDLPALRFLAPIVARVAGGRQVVVGDL